MNKIIIINGLPQSGKDTFVRYCANAAPDMVVINSSIVNHYKNQMMRQFEWDGVKTREARNLLAALLEYDWKKNKCFGAVNTIVHTVENFKEYRDGVIFVHCRQTYIIKYLAEVFRIRTEYDVKTLLVCNNRCEKGTNDADRDVFNYNYDYTIYNDSGLDNLKEEADKFIKILMEE